MRTFVFLMPILALASCGIASEDVAEPTGPEARRVSAIPEVGRYAIVHSPHGPRFTMLLDTIDGQAFIMTETPAGRLDWTPMTKNISPALED